MSELGSTTVYGDLVVTGRIFGSGGGGSGDGALKAKAEDIGLISVVDNTCVGGKAHSFTSTSNTSKTDHIVMNFEGLEYGDYSVVLRVALSNVATTPDNNYIKIDNYHVSGSTETLMSTKYIKPKDFKTANAWINLSYITKFSGYNGSSDPLLRIKISILADPTARVFYFDYVKVSTAFSAIYGLD